MGVNKWPNFPFWLNYDINKSTYDIDKNKYIMQSTNVTKNRRDNKSQ